jgi:citrate lyase synthetase
MATIYRLDKTDIKIFLNNLEEIAKSGGYSKDDILAMSEIFVVVENTKIVAFGGLACYHGFWCLRCCVVAPKSRGKGYQKKLIKTRCDFLKKKSAKYVNVWISPKNPYSLNNAISEGFRFMKEKPRTIHGIEYIKLRKYLNK